MADHIDRPGIDSDPSLDLARAFPGVTEAQALAVQLDVKRRQAARTGDRIIGHQASFTSFGIRKMFPDAPFPMVGTLLSSLVIEDGEVCTLDSDVVFVESELALVLGRDLEGDRLSRRDVLEAIDYLVPAIEIAPLRPGALEGAYSNAHMIAVQKAKGGHVIFGPRKTLANSIDFQLESCKVSVDGEVRAAATGFEAMGSPLNVIAAMAAKLHEIGEKLHAGQIIMTGSLPPPAKVSPGNRTARVDFATIGSVSVRFANPA
jgi:2-keto-4-pentenoate hydratase